MLYFTTQDTTKCKIKTYLNLQKMHRILCQTHRQRDARLCETLEMVAV